MQRRPFLILDFGSQYTQLISRRLRELGFFSEIHSYKVSLDEVKKKNPYGIILSGGPKSVYASDAPTADVKALAEIAPLMGICYGMQLICHQLGGKVHRGEVREYGKNEVQWIQAGGRTLPEVPQKQSVWMSHGDSIESLPPGFDLIGKSENHPAAMASARIFAVQFHPEVSHTEKGNEVLQYFIRQCKAEINWSVDQMLDEVFHITERVPADEAVLCALSGGVDSTVVAQLLNKKLGRERVFCLFLNNGLLRKDEFEQVKAQYEQMNFQLFAVDASKEFLTALEGLSDPEKKRKTIGRVFIEVFEKEVKKMLGLHSKIKWLAQGTLYPDVIESVSSVGGSVTIKSHHNVGGLPEKFDFKLIEPLRFLFKDEVRKIGAELGIPKDILFRHPFPGPGLAIRVLGELSAAKIKTLQDADQVFISYLKEKNLYGKIWQALCVLLPVQSVGVQGDERTYDNALVIRAVTSLDGMTADWYPFEPVDLQEISKRITNQVRGINRVVYDVTSKPPATIEWE